MACYAVGDVQGCRAELEELLERVAFDPARDRLWLLGDLINRGPDSLGVVRLVRGLGNAAVSVLGNHDLHFLAIYFGGHRTKSSDTLDDLLNASDVDDIAHWFRQLPFLVSDDKLGAVMTHAGIPHFWNLATAKQRAAEVEAAVRGPDHVDYFRAMYGNEPARWHDGLRGMARLRAITNIFTRMRFLKADDSLDFAYKGGLDGAPADLTPWYRRRAERPLGLKLLFGHWAALEGETGHDDIIALDTGCVWGRTLTALNLNNGEATVVPAR